MKKLTSLLLAAAMALSLAACGGGSTSTPNTNNPPAGGSTSQADASKPEEPAGPEPITLRIGYMPNYASLWGVLSAMEQGCFAEEGITVELTEFGDGPSEIAAMEGGSIDLAYIGKGAHRLCILGNAVIFAPSSVHTVDKVVCMPDSGIKTVADLKGKTIAYNAGSSSESTFNNALKVAGLTVEDVKPSMLSIDNIVPAAVSGSIDTAICWNPYSSQILQQVEGSYEIEFADGSTNISSWICLPQYAGDNHDTLVRFSCALYKGMDWGSQEANYVKLARVISGDVKQLRGLGLDGCISCQELRAGLPNFLPNYVMGLTLWDESSGADELIGEYFQAAYGPDWKSVQDYLSELSRLSSIDYLNGKGERNNPEMALRMAELQRVCRDFAPVLNTPEHTGVFWEALAYHQSYALALARALELLAQGRPEESAAAWRELRSLICNNELSFQPFLDVYRVLEVTEKYTGFPTEA